MNGEETLFPENCNAQERNFKNDIEMDSETASDWDISKDIPQISEVELLITSIEPNA